VRIIESSPDATNVHAQCEGHFSGIFLGQFFRDLFTQFLRQLDSSYFLTPLQKLHPKAKLVGLCDTRRQPN
jgi:hypothetical protein